MNDVATTLLDKTMMIKVHSFLRILLFLFFFQMMHNEKQLPCNSDAPELSDSYRTVSNFRLNSKDSNSIEASLIYNNGAN